MCSIRKICCKTICTGQVCAAPHPARTTLGGYSISPLHLQAQDSTDTASMRLCEARRASAPGFGKSSGNLLRPALTLRHPRLARRTSIEVLASRNLVERGRKTPAKSQAGVAERDAFQRLGGRSFVSAARAHLSSSSAAPAFLRSPRPPPRRHRCSPRPRIRHHPPSSPAPPVSAPEACRCPAQDDAPTWGCKCKEERRKCGASKSQEQIRRLGF